jgi:outer membrane lipoprotein-sorting protein
LQPGRALDRTTWKNTIQEDFLKKSFFIVSAALFICITAAGAGTIQEAGMVGRVLKNYGGSVSLSTSFELKILWKVREKEEIKRGKIMCAPGDRFRIELGDSKWVCDGTTLWQYDKTVAQVVIQRLSACDPSALPSRMLSKYLTSHAFKEQGTKGKDVVFEWVPDSSAVPQKGEARRISFTVDPKNAIVKELLVIDNSGNESMYTFYGTAFGAAPDARAFSFAIPKGARILDERQ